jgi:hypothetical protein
MNMYTSILMMFVCYYIIFDIFILSFNCVKTISFKNSIFAGPALVLLRRVPGRLGAAVSRAI